MGRTEIPAEIGRIIVIIASIASYSRGKSDRPRAGPIGGHIDVLHNHDQGIRVVFVTVRIRLISILRIPGFVSHHEVYRPARRTERFEFPDAPLKIRHGATATSSPLSAEWYTVLKYRSRETAA